MSSEIEKLKQQIRTVPLQEGRGRLKNGNYLVEILSAKYLSKSDEKEHPNLKNSLCIVDVKILSADNDTPIGIQAGLPISFKFQDSGWKQLRPLLLAALGLEQTRDKEKIEKDVTPLLDDLLFSSVEFESAKAQYTNALKGKKVRVEAFNKPSKKEPGKVYLDYRFTPVA